MGRTSEDYHEEHLGEAGKKASPSLKKETLKNDSNTNNNNPEKQGPQNEDGADSEETENDYPHIQTNQKND